MKNLIYFFAFCFLTFFIIGNANAQVPNKISYQGFLSSSSGITAHNGNYDLRFDIYNMPSGGTLLHTETHNGVDVARGSFFVILGPLPAIFSESLYVQVTALAGSPGISTDLTFSPRAELTSAPYAFHSWKADTADYALAFSGTADNADKVDGLHASLTPTANYLFPLDYAAKIPNAQLHTGGGNGLDADFLDGQHASAFSSFGHNHDATYINDGAGEINVANDFNFVASTFITNLDADLIDGKHASQFVDGSGTNNYIPKFTGSTTLGNSTIYNSGTNIGIGTTTPSAKLDVNGSVKLGNTGTVITAIKSETFLWDPPSSSVGTIQHNNFTLSENGIIIGIDLPLSNSWEFYGTGDPGNTGRNVIMRSNGNQFIEVHYFHAYPTYDPPARSFTVYYIKP